MNKTCTKCGKTKEVGEFYCRRDGHNGLNSQCKICAEAKTRKWREENKERLITERAAAYAANSEKLRQRTRDWRAKNPERTKEIGRKSMAKACRFKVALQGSVRAARRGDYMPCNATVGELKAAFTGLCGLCGCPEIECTGRFHMDHDHETGEFRGWLCARCNKALGFFGDSEELLVDALHYLMQGKLIRN